MAHLVRVNGIIEKIEPDQKNGRFSLERLQELVGGYIQLVPLQGPIVLGGVRYRIAFCDEEGKHKGKEFNLSATVEWYGSLGLFSISGPQSDYLVGDILFVADGEVD